MIVPPFPGVTSAMGLLFVDPLDDFSWAYVRRQDEIDLAGDRAASTREMEERVVGESRPAGSRADAIAVERAVDLRYIGQLHSVTVPLADVSDERLRGGAAAFHDEHLRQYRYSHPGRSGGDLDAARGGARPARRSPTSGASSTPSASASRLPERGGRCTSSGHGWVASAGLDRNALAVRRRLDGPCIVEELDSTVVLPPGRAAVVDAVRKRRHHSWRWPDEQSPARSTRLRSRCSATRS